MPGECLGMSNMIAQRPHLDSCSVGGLSAFWHTISVACSPGRKEGFAIHVYTANASMVDCCLGNADGDMLIVPQQGRSHAAADACIIYIPLHGCWCRPDPLLPCCLASCMLCMCMQK